MKEKYEQEVRTSLQFTLQRMTRIAVLVLQLEKVFSDVALDMTIAVVFQRRATCRRCVGCVVDEYEGG